MGFIEPGKIHTVLGPISADQLGMTMMHEHVLWDLTPLWDGVQHTASGQRFWDRPVSMEILGRIRHYAVANKDNKQLFDVETAIEEVNLYRRYGGGAIVDLTSRGIARDAKGLAQVARVTGINIVMGCSYYVSKTHPKDMPERSEDKITAEIVQDVTVGVDGTDIRAGIIGEIGCTWPLTDQERKVLRASAKAQRATGASLSIHPGRGEKAPMEIIELIDAAGGDVSRTVMGHLDRTVFSRNTLQDLMQSGCYLEWDLFGTEESYYHWNPGIDMPSDAKRMDDIEWVISQGYGNKVLVSQDICAKNRLKKYGGHGYSYIVDHIAPRMLERGYSEQQVAAILVKNPAQVLAFNSPCD